MYKIKELIKSILPNSALSLYHKSLVYLAMIIYRFPARKMHVVAITGTKGKTSTAEMVYAILKHAGYKTAVSSTIHFVIDGKEEKNMYKMTMPGRFFVQKFLRKALNAGTDWVVLEVSSEGAKQFRHLGLSLDALIFTNISPEHIESHGSFENYLKAKLSIGKELVNSKKRPRIIVANTDDKHGADFLSLPVELAVPFSLSDAEPVKSTEKSVEITFDNEKILANHPGEYNAYNVLAAASFAKAIGIETAVIRAGIESCVLIRGRAEHVDIGQSFDVIVDYAHTADSLEKLYTAFKKKNKICVLGNCGGGRDTWKRPLMAQVAENFCEKVILTDEDPYDEDPELIVNEMADGMEGVPEIIMDRRRAIRRALAYAKNMENSAVLITGKGTDPFICRANGEKEAWSDVEVTREELEKIMDLNNN